MILARLLAVKGNQETLLRDIEALSTFYGALFGFREIEGHRSPIHRCLDANGIDPATINQLAGDSAANLIRSHVTHKPRRIIERPGVFGSVLGNVADESDGGL